RPPQRSTAWDMDDPGCHCWDRSFRDQRKCSVHAPAPRRDRARESTAACNARLGESIASWSPCVPYSVGRSRKNFRAPTGAISNGLFAPGTVTQLLVTTSECSRTMFDEPQSRLKAGAIRKICNFGFSVRIAGEL